MDACVEKEERVAGLYCEPSGRAVFSQEEEEEEEEFFVVNIEMDEEEGFETKTLCSL